ncbi:MAG: hypothetical protein MUP04_08975 [Anaerolineae bacterium]|nr:hypothetical protein [Anaerolineae bacterium]
MAQDKVGGLLDKFKEGAEKAKKAAVGAVGDQKATQDRVGELLVGFKEGATKAKTAATEMVSDEKLAELIVNVTHKVKRINRILEGEESEFVIASFELTVGLGVPQITLAIGRR